MDKNKNILIGGLLAIVLVMSVGYAAFATSLNVTGSATVDTTWNVHFDTTKTSAVTTTTGLSGATAPTGTISALTANSATMSATLHQPGDKVVYTFTILNEGTLNAALTAPKLTVTNNSYVKWSVGTLGSSTLAAKTGSTTFTVTVEYPSSATTTPSSTEKTVEATVTFSASQATS